MTKLTLLAAIALAFSASGRAQEPPALDGNSHIFQDELLDRLAGSWNLNGIIRGRAIQHSIEARWVLNHQFLEIHEKDKSGAANNANRYEALVLVGYDNMSERYVAHWNDVYGGRFSETLGYGTRDSGTIRFVFEYPDGPFHTTFRWIPEKKQWEWLMRFKNPKGQWEDFGRMTLAR